MRALTRIKKYSRIRKMSEKDLILKEIEDIRFLIKLAYFKLSIAEDGTLVESAILELRSLELEHAYLLKKLKEMGE